MALTKQQADYYIEGNVKELPPLYLLTVEDRRFTNVVQLNLDKRNVTLNILHFKQKAVKDGVVYTINHSVTINQLMTDSVVNAGAGYAYFKGLFTTELEALKAADKYKKSFKKELANN